MKLDEFQGFHVHITYAIITFAYIILEFQLRNCKGDIGFLIDGSNSIIVDELTMTIVNHNWNIIKDFILVLARSVGISANGTRIAVVVFSTDAILEVKFTDHDSYASFERAIIQIEIPAGETNTIKGFDVALNQMFDESLNGRSNAPKTLIYLTDGKCLMDGPCLNDINVPAACRFCRCSCIIDGIDCFAYNGLCPKRAFVEWGERFERNQIRTIGIGVTDSVSRDEIIAVVGESNFYKIENFNELLTKEFRQSLAICDRE